MSVRDNLLESAEYFADISVVVRVSTKIIRNQDEFHFEDPKSEFRFKDAKNIEELIKSARDHFEETKNQHSWERIIESAVESPNTDFPKQPYWLYKSEGEPIVLNRWDKSQNSIDVADGSHRLALIKRFKELGGALHAEGFILY
ncbi:hypothetical protein [Olsenella uli]|uniref:hypothetical protein n=1 Tax=Olsenella uli TaxID=133926 RepID=UPI000569F6A3|nr:hypothetical protein [Olsenella uli]